MTPDLLHRLAGLLDARKARDLARLEALVAEDRRLAADIAALAATAEDDRRSGAPPLPPAQQALRLAWADQRIAAAARRRSDLAAAIHAARAAAVQSLGKHSALEHLADRASREAAARTAARAEQTAPPSLPDAAPR